ncbi:related to MXR2 - Methionine-R-sulfoxide reductase [Pseudozyma flocculosa]|uniref:Peptide-methionine (R)-S-oxide reductase n=1 Tax=Pseudozyma flocculosa TaxID=84751 RepID=A0A5C3F1M4_9BASI|nr:related to MXR2 - Methionine-R-sulfoxide reductase [Pseudozyma flocculosa]
MLLARSLSHSATRHATRATSLDVAKLRPTSLLATATALIALHQPVPASSLSFSPFSTNPHSQQQQQQHQHQRAFSLWSRPAASSNKMGSSASSAVDPASFPKGKPDSEWRAQLSPEQFRILRQKGTEMAGTGKYNKHAAQGVYTCAGCDTPLYKSTTKFDSGCGWPAFFDAIPGAIDRHVDRTFGMERIEITCKACGGHLGHVFKGEGFPTPTDERHCVNSVSLNL